MSISVDLKTALQLTSTNFYEAQKEKGGGYVHEKLLDYRDGAKAKKAIGCFDSSLEEHCYSRMEINSFQQIQARKKAFKECVLTALKLGISSDQILSELNPPADLHSGKDFLKNKVIEWYQDYSYLQLGANPLNKFKNLSNQFYQAQLALQEINRSLLGPILLETRERFKQYINIPHTNNAELHNNIHKLRPQGPQHYICLLSVQTNLKKLQRCFIELTKKGYTKEQLIGLMAPPAELKEERDFLEQQIVQWYQDYEYLRIDIDYKTLFHKTCTEMVSLLSKSASQLMLSPIKFGIDIHRHLDAQEDIITLHRLKMKLHECIKEWIKQGADLDQLQESFPEKMDKECSEKIKGIIEEIYHNYKHLSPVNNVDDELITYSNYIEEYLEKFSDSCKPSFGLNRDHVQIKTYLSLEAAEKTWKNFKKGIFYIPNPDSLCKIDPLPINCLNPQSLLIFQQTKAYIKLFKSAVHTAIEHGEDQKSVIAKIPNKPEVLFLIDKVKTWYKNHGYIAYLQDQYSSSSHRMKQKQNDSEIPDLVED